MSHAFLSVAARARVRSRILAALGTFLACSCTPGDAPGVDLVPALERGAFVGRFYSVQLNRRTRELRAGENRFWLTDPVLPGEGWGRVDQGWRPTGSQASLLAWRGGGVARSLCLEFLRHQPAGSSPGAELPHLQVDVSFDGRDVGGALLEAGNTRVQLELPPGPVPETSEVVLTFDPPIEDGALALMRVAFTSAEQAQLEGAQAYLLDRGTRTLTLPPGLFALPLQVPADAQRLLGELEVDGPDATDARLEVYVLLDDGRRLTLPRAPTGGRRRDISCDVTALAGELSLLVLDAHGAPGVRFRLQDLHLTTSKAVDPGSPRPLPVPQAGAREGRQPDVLVLLYDAARGDRFLPSYDRRVHPGLDELGEEALRFTSAYAECPTTSGSIPNLITGFSFLPGAGVFSGTRLATEFTTLAEHLEDLGYRTLGITANPNNARSRGFDQGFEEFHQLFGKGGTEEGIALATRAILAEAPERPLYLQLHILPPHQPYDPPPEFDRFTDPGYTGMIDSALDLTPFKLGLKSLGGDDLTHLVGLYDGNLLVADDVLRRLVEAMRAAGRWDNCLLVLTSDHGEAFMEHGVLGHNSTLFDEMLHIPLVLRLPHGARSAHADLESGACVADVLPTILAHLELQPDVGVAGVDLLAPGPRARRPIFHRTLHERAPAFAVRWGQLKVIADPRGVGQRVYQLADDPREEDNLLARRPDVYACLSLLLRDHIEAAAGLATGSKIELGEGERARLQELGYTGK